MQIENIIPGVILAVVLIGGGIYVNGFAKIGNRLTASS